MSGRATRWILLVVVPTLLALYASYPPAGVALKTVRIEEKFAQTEQEADAHDVLVGRPYPVGESLWKKATSDAEAKLHGVKVGDNYITGKTQYQRWLPLALGQRDLQTQLVERRSDGTVVQDETTVVRGRVKLGLDIAGGTELLYELKARAGEPLSADVATTIQILKQRIDPSNVKEYRIQAQENDRILIQVPAATASEVEALKSRLAKMGLLEFKIAVPHSSEDAKFRQLYEEADRGQVPEGYVKMYSKGNESGQYFLVKKEAAITGRYLKDEKATQDEFGAPAVGFTFNTIGAVKFGQITETYRNWALAIVLDGVMYSAPTIQEKISGNGIIHGSFTTQEVNDIVTILRAGSLPVDIVLLQESTVGPQLGRDSINRGLMALAVSGFLVIAFIGLYYIGCGWVADAAVLMNLLLLMGLLCILGAALTLPGMAGVLLTVGMAVDANVLIFERIREEQAAGKGVRLALHTGYDRAFPVILDSHITTLLTGAILYMVGIGPVRGFAVTLCIGILLSLFTSLTVTRLAFETFIEKGWLTEFHMFHFFKQPAFRFCAMRKWTYIGSLTILVIGMAAFVMRGAGLYDIDFTGGTLVDLALTKPASVADVRDRLRSAGFERSEVQGIRTAAATEEGMTQFSVRIKGSEAENIKGVTVPQMTKDLTAAGLMTADDSLTPTPDGHGLLLAMAKPTDELSLRKALGKGGDIYSLGNVSNIEAADSEVTTGRVMVHLPDLSAMVDPKDVWSRALKALVWADVNTQDYTIVKSDLAADGASVALTLDKPMEPQILATELARRAFGALQAAPVGTDGKQFTLTGDKTLLESFQRELPAASHMLGVPDVHFDKDTVTASLTKKFSEADVVGVFRRQGLSSVDVIPLDMTTGKYRFDLSYADVRDKLRTAFADLATATEKVTFKPSTQQAPSADVVMVDMTLSDPMVLSTIQHYIESAALGPVADTAVVGANKYGPTVLISQLTLQLPKARAQEMQDRIGASFGQPQPVQKIVTIGPTVAEELQGRALLAVIFASVGIILYLALRFHAFRWGVTAVIAVVHDLLITAGIVALADWAGVFGDMKLNLSMLAAFLTILGYSVSDTIVIFDRIRENLALTGRKLVTADLIDLSINQTLSRTVLTSWTVLIVVIVLYLMGGPVLQGLGFALIVGVITGTYSSVFVASALVLDWEALLHGTAVFFRILFFPVRLPFKLLGMARGRGR